PEEVRAVDSTFDSGLLVGVAHERDHHRHVGVDREADRLTLRRLEQGVVFVDPDSRLLRLDKRKRQRPDTLARRQQNGVAAAAGDPEWRMWFLSGLRHEVARRNRQEAALVAGEWRLHEHAHAHFERFFPLGALQVALNTKATELGLRAGL